MGENGSDAILTIKRSADDTPEVNLRNSLHAGHELASILALKLRACITEIQNKGISGLIKGLMSSKKEKKRKKKILVIIE